MKFGIFYEHQLPRPWTDDSEHQVVQEALEQIELADRLGIGATVNPNMACVTPRMCHRDEEEALARGLEGANFFGYSLVHYYVFGDHVPGHTDVWRDLQERRDRQG